MEHAEDFDASKPQDEQYYESYEDLSVHRVMLEDRPRMEFYKQILSDPAVVSGKVVVDVGSGSGVLSAWAAKAGAAHVFSIEASSMAELQELVFAENDVADRVTVLHTTVEEMTAAGPAAFVAAHRAALCSGSVAGVSLLVSEWMGFYLVHEAMLPSVLRARDFFLAVNALLQPASPAALDLVPSQARLLVAPVYLEPLYTKAFLPDWENVDGVRMTSLARAAFETAIASASPLIHVMPAESLLVRTDDVAVVWASDLRTLEVEDLACLQGTTRFTLTAPASTDTEAAEVAVDGFTLWFDVRFADHVLDTSPLAAPTHWKQTTILLPEAARAEKLISLQAVGSEPLEVAFTLAEASPGSRYYTLEFEFP